MNTVEFQTTYDADPDYIDADGNVYDADDLTELYDDALNESGTVTIGSLEYSPAEVLKSVDPTAYRVGMSDYVSALEWDEWTADHEWIVDEDDDGPVCEDCAEALSEDEATVSLSYLGRLLCEGCGKYEA